MRNKKNKSCISLFHILSFAIFLAVLVLLYISISSYGAADLINGGIAAYYRRIMAALGNLFPFSLFEIFAVCIPLFVLTVVVFAVRSFRRGRGDRFIATLLSVVLLIYSGHTLALGIGYHTTPLMDRLGLTRTEITEERLVSVMTSLRDEVNALSEEIERDGRGVSVTHYSLDGISRLLCDSFDSLSERYAFLDSFNSRVKGVGFTNLLSHLTLTGIYTFYTGEANVNTAYPAYDVAYTAAHELSHQRGILRENEANFIAYLVCVNSPDTFIRYSGALNMYSYVASALYRTDTEEYNRIVEGLSDGPRADINASGAVYREYSDTLFSDISELVNDLFLRSNGTPGTISYGMVVELMVAYFEEQTR